MLGPELHMNSDLKKNYKFVWALDKSGLELQSGFMGMVSSIVSQSKKMAELSAAVAKVFASLAERDTGAALKTSVIDLATAAALMNGTLIEYVSQMAKSVSLPDDELEMDEYQVGPIAYPVLKSKKINDIVVTYYDDTDDTVYYFHKCWLEQAVPKTDVGANTFAMRAFGLPNKDLNGWDLVGNSGCFCRKATYATYENTLNTLDYGAAGWANRAVSAAKGAIYRTVESVVGSSAMSTLSATSGILKNLSPFGSLSADPFLTYKMKQEFSQIFPVAIKRNDGDKSGSELATVEVTYRRVPKLSILRTPYRGGNSYGY